MCAIIKPFQHGAWQDNYIRWKNNKFISGGKLVPLDLRDESSLTIFWDDNIDDKEKKILSIQRSPDEIIINNDQLENLLIQSKLFVSVSTKVDAFGLPLGFILTPGQEHEIKTASTLLGDEVSEYLLADKAYDSNDFRAELETRGTIAVIPDKKIAVYL
jgi:hypothetical protein